MEFSTEKFISEITEEIVSRATEDYEKFIIETIYPYCEDVTQTIIPKELLTIALTTYKKEHPEEWDEIMERYLPHTERNGDDEDEP